jgi:hypothetical protein
MDLALQYNHPAAQEWHGVKIRGAVILNAQIYSIEWTKKRT